MEESGRLIRLYPVPFRLISEGAQFQKWQWLTALVEEARDDQRPESHRIKVDTIRLEGQPLSSKNGWAAREPFVDKLQAFSDFSALQSTRQENGVTIGLLRPARILGLDITPAKSPEWTQEERAKLVQLQNQGSLFESTDVASIATLRKIPHDFYYRYECVGPAGTAVYRHKIVDWEAGALYWNVVRQHGSQWEAAFRKKLEEELPAKNLMFLMGTIHRFPDQWLIISLIYPPRQLSDRPRQQQLL